MSSFGGAGSGSKGGAESRGDSEDEVRRSKRSKKETDAQKWDAAKTKVYYPRGPKFPPVGDRENWVRPPTPPVLVFFNAKGGTLKTTHTWTIACTLSSDLRGLKVLAVDMDSQRDLTRSMLKRTFLEQTAGDGVLSTWMHDHLSRPITDDEVATYADHAVPASNVQQHGAAGLSRSLYGALQPMMGDTPFVRRAVPEQITPRLFLLPGSPVMEDIDRRMTISEGLLRTDPGQRNWQGGPMHVIMQAARAVEADIVLLDLNPSLSTINRNMIMSSDYIVLTTRAEDYSLENMDTFMNKMVQNDPAAHTYGGSWLQQMIHTIRPAVNFITDPNNPPRYPLPETVPKVLGCIVADYSSQGNVENIRNGNRPPSFLSTQEYGVFHDHAAGAIQNGMNSIINRMRGLMTNTISSFQVTPPSGPYAIQPVKVQMTIGEGVYQAAGLTSLLAKIRSYQSLGPLTHHHGVPAPFIKHEHCIDLETGAPLTTQGGANTMVKRAADFKRRYDQLAWNILKLMNDDPGGKLFGLIDWALLDRREMGGGPTRPDDGCPNTPPGVEPGY